MMANVTTAPPASELLVLAQDAAESAARLLVERLPRTRSLVGTKTTVTDMVTEMDHAAERHVVGVLRASRPDDAIVGEEGTAEPGSTGVEWIVDPIDGTTNYLYGHPGFAVSIAAAVEGRVVAGVVADPLHAEVFSATRGGGATRNGIDMAVSGQTDLAHALVATGFSYEAPRRRRQAEVLVHVLPAVRDIRRMGAAAADLCSVACGRVDAFYEKGLARWDYAAGALIAAEAGAIVGDLHRGPASSAFTLAATPGVFDDLRNLLRDADAENA